MKKVLTLGALLFAMIAVLCACGHEHTYTEWEILEEQTCSNDGKIERKCTTCGDVETRILPALGGNCIFGKLETVKNPTCTEEGLKERSCEVCGYKKTIAIEKLDHKYKVSLVIEEATCTKEGEAEETCQFCGDTVRRSIAKKSHSFEIKEKPATCEQLGKRYKECADCDETETIEFIPRIPHDWETVVLVEPTTCTEEGLECEKCTVCKREQNQRAISAPHDWETVVLVEPTCTEEGLECEKCTVCKTEQNQRTVYALSHKLSYEKTGKNKADAKCEHCDYETTTEIEVEFETYNGVMMYPFMGKYKNITVKATGGVGNYTYDFGIHSAYAFGSSADIPVTSWDPFYLTVTDEIGLSVTYKIEFYENGISHIPCE